MDRESIQLRDKTGKPLGRPVLGGFMYYGGDLFDAVPVPRDWGPWRLSADHRVLCPIPDYPPYEVDLEECLTPAAVMDRIVQISQKAWADDAVLAGLLRALDDILNPQATLCSGGSCKRLRKARVRELASVAISERMDGLRIYADGLRAMDADKPVTG